MTHTTSAKLFVATLFLGSGLAQQVSEVALRSDIAYLAAIERQGRASPSAGLDEAANYIGASFARAGLDVITQDVPVRNGTARNVIGVLRGSDPMLRDTYVILSAHYDHVGVQRGQIYPGANDDASGTAGVIESAVAISARSVRPKRSIVFIAFCCEETGLLGSRFYADHPVFPLRDTIAHLNLEQIGRTDAVEGPHVASVSITGAGFSNLAQQMTVALSAAGIETYSHKQGDQLFGASDNLPLAVKGVPAHTLFVAGEYPEYHRPGDTADKLNYPNFAKVTYGIVAAVLALGSNLEEPQWNEGSPAAARFAAAYRELHKRP